MTGSIFRFIVAYWIFQNGHSDQGNSENLKHVIIKQQIRHLYMTLVYFYQIVKYYFLFCFFRTCVDRNGNKSTKKYVRMAAVSCPKEGKSASVL